MDGKSPEIVKDKLEQLKAILPEAFTEGIVDWEKLRLALGEDVEISDERYVLNWAGKGDAFRSLQTPTTATLAPAEHESINFGETENIFIEGENLEVLKILQKAYYGKIKMTYIDPPYNTGNDSFVYPDRFAESREDYLKRINDKDEDGLLTREGLFRKNSKDSGHYHSNWLSMMLPRLYLSRNLLRKDGFIFVSIDDNELHNLRLLMNEIFGEENFVACIANVNNPKGRSDDKYIATAHEYLLIYRKSADALLGGFKPTEVVTRRYRKTDENGERFRDIDLRKTGDADRKEDRPSMFYAFFYNEETEELFTGKAEGSHKGFIKILPQRSDGNDGRWRWEEATAKENIKKIYAKYMPQRKIWGVFEKDFLKDKKMITPTSAWTFKDVNSERGSEQFIELGFDKEDFLRPKPVGLLKRIIQIGTTPNDNDIVLDFFCGSGTLAEALIEKNCEDMGNRRFILVQMPERIEDGNFETVAEIAKERIRRVIEKSKKENPMFAENGQDMGFKVFKLKHSNFKLWRGDGIENQEVLEQQLEMLADPVRAKALEEHMLFELLLKSGYPLNSQVEKREIRKAHYYLIDGDLAIALSHLDERIIKDILDAEPQQVICLDSLFAENDPLKTNTQLQFKDAGITFHSV